MDNELNRPPMLTRQQAAAVVYHDLKEAERVTFQLAGEYGKWLIASLLLIHAGALFGMFSFLDSIAEHPEKLAGYKMPIWAFVAGLISALLSGFSIWLNWSMHAANYRANAKYEMLWDPGAWIGDPVHTIGIKVSYWVSIVLGFLSAVCILVGALAALHGPALAAVWQTHS